MKLLCLYLINMAVAAWQLPYPERHLPKNSVSCKFHVQLYRLQSCRSCKETIGCKSRDVVTMSRSPIFLLNYTFTDHPVPLRLNGHNRSITFQLWVTCEDGMDQLSLILHHHAVSPSPNAVWKSSVRGCRRPPRILLSSSGKDSAHGWNDSQIDVKTKLSFDSKRALIFLARDEKTTKQFLADSTSNCHKPRSTFIPRQLILISSRSDIIARNVVWIHLTDVMNVASSTVRVELSLTGVRSSFICILTTENGQNLKLSIHIDTTTIRGFSQVDIWSSQGVVVDNSHELIKFEVDQHLSQHQIMLKLGSQGINFHRHRIIMPVSNPLPSELLLRISLTNLIPPKNTFMFPISRFFDPSNDTNPLPVIVTKSECLQNGQLVFQINTIEAQKIGLSLSELAINSPSCFFNLMSNNIVRKGNLLRIILPIDKCGSKETYLDGHIVYSNSLIAYQEAKPQVFLKTLTCTVRVPRHRKPSTDIVDSSYSLVPGRDRVIKYISKKYNDHHIVACGVQGSQFPIYTVFYNNRSVDNRLLAFNILPKKEINLQEILVRFKEDYPDKNNPYQVVCVIEGCRNGVVIQSNRGNDAQCSSGENVLRSKELLVHLSVNWSQSSNPIPNRVRLYESLFIWIGAFLIGVIFVLSFIFVHNRLKPINVPQETEVPMIDIQGTNVA